jgi:hypothetical protein
MSPSTRPPTSNRYDTSTSHASGSLLPCRCAASRGPKNHRNQPSPTHPPPQTRTIVRAHLHSTYTQRARTFTSSPSEVRTRACELSAFVLVKITLISVVVRAVGPRALEVTEDATHSPRQSSASCSRPLGAHRAGKTTNVGIGVSVDRTTKSCCVPSVRFGSVHLVWYEEALDGRTGPLPSRPYMNRKSFGS